MTDPRPATHPTTLAQAFALTDRQARAAYAAVRAVAEADGPARTGGAALLRVAADTLERTDPDAIPAATADELAAAFPTAAARRTLVDALLIPACIDGEVTAAGESVVRSFARALGVRSHWVGTLRALRRRDVLAVKLQLVRRSPDARRLFARTWAEDGLAGIWRAFLFILGRHTDPALATRFRGLARLPEGTLGRRLFGEFTARGFAFPGEPHGMPERMLHHDLMHIANGYSTEPAGECELAGFYAAFCPGDAFTFIVIVLATFHLGLPVSPAAITPARGAFDPARVVASFLRGRRLRVDVMGPWDYWALMPLPLAEVRVQLGIADPPGART
jgi:hypothetical protein